MSVIPVLAARRKKCLCLRNIMIFGVSGRKSATALLVVSNATNSITKSGRSGARSRSKVILLLFTLESASNTTLLGLQLALTEGQAEQLLGV